MADKGIQGYSVDEWEKMEQCIKELERLLAEADERWAESSDSIREAEKREVKLRKALRFYANAGSNMHAYGHTARVALKGE